MTRTRTGGVSAILPALLLVADSYFGLGFDDDVRGVLVMAMLGGIGLALDGFQRRTPRGSYARGRGRVPTTTTKAAVEEVLRDKRRKEPSE